MSIAQDMKNITEDIEVSYGARMAAVGDLIKETHGTLSGFRKDRNKMATDLWYWLSSDRANRAKSVKEMMGEIRSDLKEMAKVLEEFLARSEGQRKEEYKALLAEIRRLQKARNEELFAFLASFRESHKEMAVRMRKELTSSRRELVKVVSEMLGTFEGDQKLARSYWQNLAKVMAARRGGRVPLKKVEIKVPKKVEIVAEKAIGKGELKARILSLIRENPGITLSELGKAFKVPYITLAIPVRDFIGEGKVEKRDSKYYPA